MPKWGGYQHHIGPKGRERKDITSKDRAPVYGCGGLKIFCIRSGGDGYKSEKPQSMGGGAKVLTNEDVNA